MDHSPLLNPVTLEEARAGLPSTPGLYAWWITDPQSLAVPLTTWEKGLGLIYLGIAKSGPDAASDLRSRVLGKHIRGSLGNSTLRRSLAAMLWEEQAWKPIRPSDRVLLSPEHNHQLTRWIDTHLRVAWLPHPEPWTIEAELIALLQPPLNVMANQNHPFYNTIKAARARLEAAAAEVQAPKAALPTAAPAVDITAAQLAEELGIEAKALRIQLRALAAAGKIAGNSSRWSWTSDSPDLKVIREALGS